MDIRTPNLRKKMSIRRSYVTLLIVLTNCFTVREANSKTASVCTEDQLTVTCSTNGTSIEWDVTHPHMDPGIGLRQISINRERLEPFVTSLGVFTFYRTSTSPLMSVLEIVNITADLNDTRVNCAHVEGMSTTVITVIQNAISNLSIIKSNESYETKNVSLLLELDWTREDVMYNVTVLPTPPSMSTDNDQIRLTVFYNMFYDVTVTTLCGQTTKVIHYVKCDDQVLNLFSDVMVSGYTDPALVGTNVTIICPTVTGSNTTLVIYCLEGGLWEPDPRKILCAELATGSHTSSSTDAAACCDMHNGFNTTFTTEISDKSREEKPSLIIATSTTPVIIVSLLISLIIIILIVYFNRKKGKVFSRNNIMENAVIMLDEPQGPIEPPEQQFSLNEYSLVQPHSPQEQTNNSVQFHQPQQPQSLVYADLGPGSFQRQKNVVVDTYKFDDDRVEYAQVITNKLSSRKEELQPVTVTVDHSCADDSLNLDSLLIQIKPEVTPNWYKFGEAIGVDDKVLDRCIPYPPEESIVEVCDHWLRNHSGKPTWREVAEALGQTNFQQLAFDIEKVYETGKLPKKVNMNDTDDVFDDEIPPPIPPKLLL